jgi:hypothetical protein
MTPLDSAEKHRTSQPTAVAGGADDFLTRVARRGGPAPGVEAAVLFDVPMLSFEGPQPWEQ